MSLFCSACRCSNFPVRVTALIDNFSTRTTVSGGAGFSFSGSTTLVLDCSGYGGPALVLPGPGARRSLCRGRGPALCVGARADLSRRSFCRGPALCVGAPSALCVGRSFFAALCVRARRSLCRGPALLVSRPGLFGGVGARCSLSRVGVGARCSSALSVGVCVAARRSSSGAVCVGPGTPCVVSGPGGPCVGARCSLSRVGVGARRSSPRLYFPGTDGLCVGSCAVEAQRSVCRGPALLVSGLSVGLRPSLSGCVWSPDCFCIGARLFSAFCVGARLSGGISVSGPDALCRRAPVVSVSETGSLFL